MTPPFSRHVLERTVVLPDHRILFLPVPKAGCTSMLAMLAELAGLDRDRFERSTQAEVSPALTVHDISLWPAELRLSSYAGAERDRMLTAPGWLRFSLVRDPASRLWSAWLSKLLLREPRFATEFGRETWFPGPPESPKDLIDDFRAFVAAVARPDGPRDVHWAVQQQLVSQLPLTHVGRIEQLTETMMLLRSHLASEVAMPSRRRLNATTLPLPPHAFDEPAARLAHAHYRADHQAYGYEPRVPAPAPEDWDAEVAGLLPLLHLIAEEHARVGQLSRTAVRFAERARHAERRLHARAVRHGVPARSPVIPNREGDTEFDVRWAWADGPLDPGMTGVVRVKNEAASLPWVLPPLLRAVEHVVLVDNASTDGTADVARAVAATCGASDRLEVHIYPFAIARCGAEHLETPADSLHSLTYFYNWCFAHVRTRYALKWDGDMVLTDAAVAQLRDLAWQLEAVEAVIRVPRSPLYIAGDGRAFLDRALRNREPWGWPNRPGYSFVKALEWELPLWGGRAADLTLPEPGCFELKHLDADEFGHWSSTDFDGTARTRRKRREWEVFSALRDDRPPPPGVEEIVAPAGVHVVDHVRSGGSSTQAAEVVHRLPAPAPAPAAVG